MSAAQVFLIKCGLNDLIISKPGHNQIYVSDIVQIFLDSIEPVPDAKTEKQVIMELLEANNFRIDKTSAELGCSPNTLYRKRKKYGLL